MDRSPFQISCGSTSRSSARRYGHIRREKRGDPPDLAGTSRRPPLVRTKHTWACRLICPSALRRREVGKPAVYDRAMGLFRSAVGLFRGRARKDREEAATGLPKEQDGTVEAPADAAREEVLEEQAGTVEAPADAAREEVLEEQAGTVEAPADAARGEVKFEARPNPDNPGWGQTIGQEIGKTRQDRPSQE